MGKRETIGERLMRYRAGLLSPKELFARLQERFAAGDTSRGAVTEQVSKGDAPKQEWHLVGTDIHCIARTKSEARSLMKKELGGKIPSGSVVRRV